MNAAQDPPIRPRKRSLRQRVVAAFAGLALIPFVLAMAILFFVARHDVETRQGASLALKAGILAEQLAARIESAGRAASSLAGLPEVRDFLLGRTLYPTPALADAQRLLPDLRDLSVGRASPPSRAAEASVLWVGDGMLEFRIDVSDAEGVPLGFLLASFAMGRLGRPLEERSGLAVLYDSRGRLLAGSAAVPLPPAQGPSNRWASFEAAGESHYAGIAPLQLDSIATREDWFLAVVQPASEVYEHFNSVARQMAVLLAALAIVVLALAWRMADLFLRPILKIRHGAEIVARANLDYRIDVDTGDELEDLAREFNHMAESLAGAYGELEDQVRDTTRSLQEERNRLATVLRTMAEAVVVTNELGETTLMNPRARLALGKGPSSGIGSPLSRILPADRLAFHLRRLRKSWDEGQEAVEDVVFPMPHGPLLKGFASVVPAPDGSRAGFLLVFRDISAKAEEEGRVEEALREMPELLKGPVATAGSLIDALERHPDMPDSKKAVFLTAVGEEIGRLAERLEVAEQAAAAAGSSRWPGVPSDPRELLEEAVASVPGVFAQVEVPEQGLAHVLVEPFSWVAALACVLRWSAERSSGWAPVGASLHTEDEAVVATFRVEGDLDVDPSSLEALEVAPAGEAALPLGEAVRRNRGELWTRTSNGGFEVCLGLMPVSVAPSAAGEEGIVDEQPEFYDFDLFLPRPSFEGEAMLGASLDTLEYVVFDSETTGLHPSKGDEMVSLSAVRIRRGKIQSADTFHTLVRPDQSIPTESTRIHGIRDLDVDEAPRMGEVLRRFYEYAGSSVLVAHNAAFDKKFLDLAASREGLPQMENPILDTLFLSYGIHRDFEGHNLEAIAGRLGIPIEGRHTSLGDANATAQIFLRLISLLEARDVRTLGDAKAFCDRMLLLRWQSSRF